MHTMGRLGTTVVLLLGAAGAATQTMPSGTGTRLQILGTAMSATQLDFQPNAGTLLA